MDRLEPRIKHTEEMAKERTITEEDLIRAEVQKKGKSLDESREEIIARACEDMLKMSDRGKRIFNSLSETDRKTLIQKLKGLVDDLLNWVNDLLNSYESTSTEARIMREYKEHLQKAAKVWDEMLGKSIKANQSLEKSGAFGNKSADGNVVYALREEAISEVEQAISEVEQAISNKNYDKEIKLTNSSPAILISQKNVKNLPMMMVASHIRENVLTEKEARALGLKVNSGINYHGLGKTLFLKVIDGLDNVTEAYRGTKNAEDTSRRENYFLLISQYKDNGNTINVPVYVNEGGMYNEVYTPNNKIATVFGKRELEAYIQREIRKGNLVRIKNRSTQASESSPPIGDNYSKSASKDSIPNSNEKVKEKYSDRDYSYDELVAKPDMKMTVLDANVPNNRADIIHQAKKNAAKVGNVNVKDKTVSVYVNDIGKDVVLGTDGLQHGMARGKNIQNRPIAIVTLKAGEIIKNSIRINELTPSKKSATGSYVLIGAAIDSDSNLYLVRSVVNEYGNKLASMDVLYAINTKKESAMLNASRYANDSLSVTDSTISIAELLDYVNKYFPDILPESVLRHYGYDARPEGELGESALYSEREDISVYDIMGEKDRILKENENFKVEIERLKERLKLERKITKGSILNDNQLLSAAGHLRNISNSTIDKVQLARSLKDVYSFIANSDNLTWEEVFEKCHTIAEAMLEKAKPEVMVDDYYKQILKDIRNTF